MKYALVKDNVITNIIVADYSMANMLANETEQIAINCDNYPVSIGDIYENGSFMNAEDITDDDGNILIPARTVIERRMTDEEYIYMLEEENLDLKLALADMAETYENKITELQLALAEIVEGGIING